MNAHAITSSVFQGSVRSYAVRLGLSILLFVGPFGAVMTGIVPRELSLPAIVVLCVGQLLVQLVWSVHPGTRKDQRENTANVVCTGLVIAIMVAGYFR
jgi:cytochrome o ubiquinol oxidase operon protein cyoD